MLHRFWDIVEYWSKLHLRQGDASLYTFVGSETLNSAWENLASKTRNIPPIM